MGLRKASIICYLETRKLNPLKHILDFPCTTCTFWCIPLLSVSPNLLIFPTCQAVTLVTLRLHFVFQVPTWAFWVDFAGIVFISKTSLSSLKAAGPPRHSEHHSQVQPFLIEKQNQL